MAQNNVDAYKPQVLISIAAISLVLGFIGLQFGSLMSYAKDPLNGLDYALANLFFSCLFFPIPKNLGINAWLGALVGGFTPWVAWAYLFLMPKASRQGEECGSARWGTLKEGKSFMDEEKPDNNLLFTKNYGLALKRQKFDLERDRNLNVLVIGGSGSGKTRYYVKPNLMQMNSSYFVTDPKGTCLQETGEMFARHGYDVRVFDLINLKNSMHYNPLAYVKSDLDILSFVNALIKNTNGDKKQGGDAFWENCERLLFTACIAFLRDWTNPEDYTLDGLIRLLELAEAKDDDDSFESPLDLLFKQIETGKKYSVAQAITQAAQATTSDRAIKAIDAQVKSGEWVATNLVHNTTKKCPADTDGISPSDDFALHYYKEFKKASGKTLKSILISCAARLSSMAVTDVRELLSKSECEMKLDCLGDPDQKAIIYGIMSDTDKSLSFLFAIMMWQTIDQLCKKALSDYGGKLPTPVHLIFDEFANIGTIPDIEQSIAVTRSRNIFLSIILQSVSQLQSRYDKDAETIIDCCDTTLFLGGKSVKTNEEISKMLGKETFHQINFNQTKGQSGSVSFNHSQTGRDLLDPAEIGKISRGKAILMISGTQPLIDDKYPIEAHMRYKFIDPDPDRIGAEYDTPFDHKAYKLEIEAQHKEAVDTADAALMKLQRQEMKLRQERYRESRHMRASYNLALSEALLAYANALVLSQNLNTQNDLRSE